LALLPIQGVAAQASKGAERFSCDTPGGRFSRYQRPLASPRATLSANVQIHELRTGTDWLPVVNVMLNGGDTDKRAGFRLLPDREKKRTHIYLVFPGMTTNQVVPLGDSDLGKPLALSINVSEQESRLSVNGTDRSGPALSGVQWNLDLSCSSIDARLEDIVVNAP
jgi:hypothetical protein